MNQIGKQKKIFYEIAERRGHVLSRATWRKYRSKKHNGIIVTEFNTYCVLCEKTAFGTSHPEIIGEYVRSEMCENNCTVGGAKVMHPKSFHLFYNPDEKASYAERIRKAKESLNKRFNIPE